MERRVVITGLGTVTSIGLNVEDFWENVKKGVNGISKIDFIKDPEFPVKVAGVIKNFQAKNYMDRKEVKRQERFSKLAVVASIEAVKMAKLDMEVEDPYKVGVIVGSGVGSIGTLEEEKEKFMERGFQRTGPLFVPKFIPNMASGNVAIHHGMKGKNIAVVTACASGTQSIGEAFKAIKYKEADVMLAGGSESCLTPLCLAGFNALTALSTNPDIQTASRPFDKNRDGFVMGEGAGILVLEELEHARKRGANILAEIGGYGATCDAYHITSPAEDGMGAVKAMEFAIQEGGISKEEVSYINAHGTSTPYNDRIETTAIKTAFKEHAKKIAINSTKSLIGHLLGGAGAVEAIVCVKSIEDQFVHQTLGYSNIDKDCDLDYVTEGGRKMKVNYALSNSLGFGGHNGSLLFKKFVE